MVTWARGHQKSLRFGFSNLVNSHFVVLVHYVVAFELPKVLFHLFGELKVQVIQYAIGDEIQPTWQRL